MSLNNLIVSINNDDVQNEIFQQNLNNGIRKNKADTILPEEEKYKIYFINLQVG